MAKEGSVISEKEINASYEGKIIRNTEKWDNGFYTAAHISQTAVDMLIDNGSSATLLSYKIFEQIDSSTRPMLRQSQCSMKDVTGKEIKVYGTVELPINLGGTDYWQKVTICEMAPDGILGQDFLLQYVKSVDYEKYTLKMKTCSTIQCWLGQKDSMICRVLAAEETVIPGNSSVWISVAIPGKENLQPVALVEGNDLSKTVQLLPGLINTDDPKSLKLSIVNASDESATIHRKTAIGFCMSFRELKQVTIEHCAQVSSMNRLNYENKNQELPEFLQDLYNRSAEHINEYEKEMLQKLLTTYEDVFAKNSNDLGLTDRIEHNIDVLPGTEPIRQPMRRLPLAKREVEQKEIQAMLDKGVIEPSISPWCSNLVIVKKKDGQPRMCVDYRQVNEVVKKDSYPLPRMDECLDSLSGNSIPAGIKCVKP